MPLLDPFGTITSTSSRTSPYLSLEKMSWLWPCPVTAFTSAFPPGFTSSAPGLEALTTASPTAHLALALFLISQPDKSFPLRGSVGGSAKAARAGHKRNDRERRRSFIVW